jgi:dienelactone hydrolase
MRNRFILVFKRFLICSFVAGLLVHLPVGAQERGETVWIPMQSKGLFGSRQIKLEATLYKPRGEGPFAVVIFNHGSTGGGAIPAEHTVYPSDFGAYLLNKGIALLIPMRRGRGQSEGTYEELPLRSRDCSLHQARWGVRYATESLDAVYDFLKVQPWVNMRRIILSGVSRGGMLSVIYAADHPEAAIGVLNFVGGWESDTCSSLAGVDINAALFKEAAGKANIPHLFLYATNDHYYSPSSIANFVDAFRAGGSPIELKLYEMKAGEDGHSLFYRPWKWDRDVDQFLTKTGLSTP